MTPLPCLTCRHRGPAVAGRTTCRLPAREDVVGWIERVGEMTDGEVRGVETCPGYGREVRR